MKIEIEYSEIEALKKEIEYKQQKIDQLNAELKAINAEQLKKDAIELSKTLFDNYMTAVYRELGFDNTIGWNRGSVDFKDNLEHWLGKNWWNSERLQINIGANISQQWRTAYLSLGIKPNTELKEV